MVMETVREELIYTLLLAHVEQRAEKTGRISSALSSRTSPTDQSFPSNHALQNRVDVQDEQGIDLHGQEKRTRE